MVGFPRDGMGVFAPLSPENVLFANTHIADLRVKNLLSSSQTMVVAVPNALLNADNEKKRKTTLEKAKAHHVRNPVFIIFFASKLAG